ncbi:hypothetical protein Pfo_022900, partial [Paulownia fortunei]
KKNRRGENGEEEREKVEEKGGKRKSRRKEGEKRGRKRKSKKNKKTKKGDSGFEKNKIKVNIIFFKKKFETRLIEYFGLMSGSKICYPTCRVLDQIIQKFDYPSRYPPLFLAIIWGLTTNFPVVLTASLVGAVIEKISDL